MDEIEIDRSETVGERLRAAREAQKLSLDAVAAHTRIPVRHLDNLEAGRWDELPAPAYCVGFAKNYAAMVGLDREEVAAQLRSEIGGTRQTFAPTELFEPADPKRTMPKWLVIGAIAGVAIVLLALNWMRQRELAPAPPPTPAAMPVAPVAPPTPVAATPAAGDVVTLVALQDVWLKVRDNNGVALREGLLRQGESFAVPSTAAGPTLDTGRPEALRIMVGNREAPPVGKAGRSVSGVSLTASDLVAGGAAARPPSAPAATPPTAPARPRQAAPAPRTRPATPPAVPALAVAAPAPSPAPVPIAPTTNTQ